MGLSIVKMQQSGALRRPYHADWASHAIGDTTKPSALFSEKAVDPSTRKSPASIPIATHYVPLGCPLASAALPLRPTG